MRLIYVCLVTLGAACGGASSSSSGGGPSGVTTPAQPLTGEEQVALGAQLYGEKCAKCHGASGEGSDKAPPVVGPEAFPLSPRPGAKRDVEFRTALDVFQWTKVHMPGDDPGSLSDEDMLAIFAFDLKANGVDLQGKPLDGEIAAGIKLH